MSEVLIGCIKQTEACNTLESMDVHKAIEVLEKEISTRRPEQNDYFWTHTTAAEVMHAIKVIRQYINNTKDLVQLSEKIRKMVS